MANRKTMNMKTGKRTQMAKMESRKEDSVLAKMEKTKQKKDNVRPIRGKKMPAKQYELLMLGMVALFLLLGIAVYFRNEGNFLGKIRYFLFGVFGISAYILPIFGIIGFWFKVFNQGNRRLDIKIKLGTLLLVSLSMIAHIFYVSQAQIHLNFAGKKMLFQVLANFFRVSGRYAVGGGFLGGLFGDLLLVTLGKLGSIVIAFLIFFTLIILLTEISPVQLLLWINMLFSQIFHKLKEAGARQKEKKVLAAEEEQENVNQDIVTPLPFLRDFSKRKNPNFFQKEGKEGKEDGAETTEAAPLSEGITTSETISESEKTVHPESDVESAVAISIEEAEEELKISQDIRDIAEIFAEEKNIEPAESQEHLEPEISEMVEEELESIVVSQSPEEKVAEPPVEKIESDFKPVQESLTLSENINPYQFPPLELLKEPSQAASSANDSIEENIKKLEDTLKSFGVGAKVINVSQGPTVTRYEIQPAQGVKVSRVVNLADDIALNLAAEGIRIEAPIPGKSAIGIEVPNQEAKSVFLREVIGSEEFANGKSKLSFGLGKDIAGKVLVTDIAKMPHLLIAGATGSGKSVCINTLIVSLLYKSSPEEVRLLMIDPKVVELSVYNGIPHLLIPVVTDPKKAASALNWAVQEMNERYRLFAATASRNLSGYNRLVEEKGETPKLPQIVIVIDELADLMMVASSEVEDAICRLTQMARAAGIHLIIATQRPSVDVITGLIKANVPSRIAFNVSSGIDSRTILDMNGAEKLLGKGDMLFYPASYPKPIRIQGAFISDKEVESIVDYLKSKQQAEYNAKIMNHLRKEENQETEDSKDDLDELFAEALELVVEKEKASASLLQRYFRLGFNRAARLIDQLEEAGYVGAEQGSKPREVLITRRELEELKQKANAGKIENTGQAADSSWTEEEEVNDSINQIVEELNQPENK